MLEARSGLVCGRFGVRLTWEHLALVWWSGVTMLVGRNHSGQAGKPDDLLSEASLCCVMASVVSPGVGTVCSVARPIPPSGQVMMYLT